MDDSELRKLIEEDDKKLYESGREDMKAEIIKMIEEEKKDIGYEEGQEKPNLVDEVNALVYESNADAWFAGWDKCCEFFINKLKE
jgi:hypothetical protein